jgi:hypothetical protein
MKTTDGGLHWETISPDLTGATPMGAQKAGDEKAAAPPSLEDAKRRGTESYSRSRRLR